MSNSLLSAQHCSLTAKRSQPPVVPGPFFGEFACSLHVCVGFNWKRLGLTAGYSDFLPLSDMHVRVYADILVILVFNSL